MRSRSQLGMTMIELLIITSIVGVLAAIALPAFHIYRLRARASETAMIMSGIRVSQTAFGAVNDNFANVTTANPVAVAGVSKRLWDTAVCPVICGRLAPLACTEFSCIGYAPNGDVYHTYVSPSGASAAATSLNEFAIGASGDLDADGAPSGWAFQTANDGAAVGTVIDAISGCFFPVPAFETQNCRPTSF